MRHPTQISISVLLVATSALFVGCGESAKPEADGGAGAGGSDSNGGNAGSNNVGGSDSPDDDAGAPATIDASVPNGDSGAACAIDTESHAVTSFSHVPECTPLTFESNPPSSGNHFVYWAAFGIYDFPLPRGYWVHNLEHGSVVVSYNCPNGCADEVTAAKSWLAALPIDDTCVAQGVTKPRAILTPDPKLDTAWAASAWGWTLRAECFDSTAFTAFYDAHVNQGRESTCSPGLEFRNADGSRADTLPADCGE